MPEGTSQDSRDPNSPQWGYLKVKNPEELRNENPVETDTNWNEYVMFVHDAGNNGDDKIEARTDVKFVMVPATLTIGVDKNNTDGFYREYYNSRITQLKEKLDESKEQLRTELSNEIELLEKICSNTITIPSSKKEKPDKTTIWVGFVVG